MASIRVNAASLSAFSTLESNHQGGIDIPANSSAKGDGVRRRVSFNLRDTSVLQLPSNTAINKIAQARNQRRLSLSNVDGSGDVLGRHIQSMLPHGASPELLDPGFSMTSLYVKKGHIHSLDHQQHLDISQAMPRKGVLKPFTPSPVDANLLMYGVPSKKFFNDEEDTAENEEGLSESTHSATSSSSEEDGDDGPAKCSSGSKKQRKAKKGKSSKHGAKKKSKQHQQKHNGGHVPLVQPITNM